jgi:hypothetical protein
VIFEANHSSKSTIQLSPTTERPIGFDLDIHGALLCGTPTLAGDTKFLGFQDMPDVSPAIATLKQVERMGAMAAVAICRKTDVLRWGLPARKLCLEKVHTVIQHLLPLAFTAPMAAARLTSMQGRWAHIICMSRATMRTRS